MRIKKMFNMIFFFQKHVLEKNVKYVFKKVNIYKINVSDFYKNVQCV